MSAGVADVDRPTRDSQLDLRGIITRFPDKLGDLEPTLEIIQLLSPAGAAPLQSSDQLRACVRDLLRTGRVQARWS